MEDPLDMRDELETDSLIDLEPGVSPVSPVDESADKRPMDFEDRALSLFTNREEEPEADDPSETPVDLLMKSGQPRLSLVHGDDEIEEDAGLIDLAPAEPTPTEADDVADNWPWLADTEADDEAPLLKALDAQFDADMASPTACGALPTSGDISRRPMPSLPPKGEIAAVAQRVGTQFAGDMRTSRTPDVPALLTSMPKTLIPSAPIKTTMDRPVATPPAAVIAAPSISTPIASIAIPTISDAIPALMPEIPAARVTISPSASSAPSAPRKSPETPKRIGDGKLVQSRLTWKPGDPFADGAKSPGMPSRFRWELMLSTACGTAVFGLAFFWIMRMVF